MSEVTHVGLCNILIPLMSDATHVRPCNIPSTTDV